MKPPPLVERDDDDDDEVMESVGNEEKKMKLPSLVESDDDDDDDQVMESVGNEEKKMRSQDEPVGEPCKRLKSSDQTDEEKFISPPENARIQLCCFKIEYERPFKAGNLFGFVIATGIPGKLQLLSIDPSSEYATLFHHEHWANEGVYRSNFLYPNCSCSISASTYVEILSQIFLSVKDEYNYIEVVHDYYGIDFLQLWLKKDYEGSHSVTLEGENGFIKLYYVAIKSAVNAVLEVSFEGENRFYEKEDFIVRIFAYYDYDFKINVSDREEKDSYKIKIFETGSYLSYSKIKQGKLSLMQSVVAVPDKSPLIIDAYVLDCRSEDVLMDHTHRFPAPLTDFTDTDCMKGVGCSFTVKVNWKSL